MKPWIKKTLIGLFGATLLAGSLSACSHSQRGYGANASAEDIAKFRGKMIDRVASKLDLNEEQKKRLNIVADKFHEQRTAMMAQGKEPRAELKALISGEKFDRTRAQTLVTEKTTAVQGKSPEMIAAIADFYDSLSPAQQQKVRDFMEHRGGWFRHS